MLTGIQAGTTEQRNSEELFDSHTVKYQNKPSH